MRTIDLHMHSTFSDGSFTPSELIALAAQKDLAAVALTDHDTVAGIPEFLAAAKAYPGLEAIAGVELSCSFSSREIHIIGLYVDCANAALQTFLENARKERIARNETIRRKLITLNYPFTWDELQLNTDDCASVGRPHIARIVAQKYHFPDLQSVFDKLLNRGCPAYVPRHLPPPNAAIAAIKNAGGLAVWAHPIYRERNERAWARRLMRKLGPVGLDAVETYYSMFGAAETQMLTELAGLYGLDGSGGSDFHGDNSPGIEIGSGAGKMRIPESILQSLKGRLSCQKK